MNYFQNCKTQDEAKQLYYKLAIKLHPDVGGTTQGFQDLQNEFEAWKPTEERYEGEYAKFGSEDYESIIEQLTELFG